MAAADRADDMPALVAALEAVAADVAADGDYEKAACILGATDGLRGDAPSSAGRTLALIEEAIGTVRLAELTAEGRHMARADIVALALATT
ncbi:MAG: hypothetical protein QOG87_343 [Actinomycetota bacterium]